MSDALDLIAEARARQEAAERDRDIWRERAQFERRRCRATGKVVTAEAMLAVCEILTIDPMTLFVPHDVDERVPQ